MSYSELATISDEYPPRQRTELLALAEQYQHRNELEVLELAGVSAGIAADDFINLGR